MDVDGAVCRDAGATADCPSGQACGNDGRCSERAAACLATRCTPGPVFCASPDGAEVEGCSDADSVCGARVPVPCSGTLGAALSAAAERARATGGTIEVAIHARGAGEAIFGVATGETFPVEVPADVALVGSTAPGGAAVLRAESAATILSVAGTVQGLRVESAGASGTGISVACGASGTPSLVDVAVEGGGALTRGVSLTGACGLEATALRVANVAGPGIYVDAALGAPSVPSVGAHVQSGIIEDCLGAGAEVRGGTLALNGVVLRRNRGFGVSARARDELPRRAIALEMNDSTSEDNGEAGLVVRSLEPGSTLRILRSTFRWNAATTAEETEFFDGRRAGGVYLFGPPPATLVFQGNRVYGNANEAAVVDQLVTLTGSAWDLSGSASCGALANVFACPGNGYLVYGHGGRPLVRRAHWPTDPPELWPPATLVFNADYTPDCGFDAAPIPACSR